LAVASEQLEHKEAFFESLGSASDSLPSSTESVALGMGLRADFSSSESMVIATSSSLPRIASPSAALVLSANDSLTGMEAGLCIATGTDSQASCLSEGKGGPAMASAIRISFTPVFPSGLQLGTKFEVRIWNSSALAASNGFASIDPLRMVGVELPNSLLATLFPSSNHSLQAFRSPVAPVRQLGIASGAAGDVAILAEEAISVSLPSSSESIPSFLGSVSNRTLAEPLGSSQSSLEAQQPNDAIRALLGSEISVARLGGRIVLEVDASEFTSHEQVAVSVHAVDRQTGAEGSEEIVGIVDMASDMSAPSPPLSAIAISSPQCANELFVLFSSPQAQAGAINPAENATIRIRPAPSSLANSQDAMDWIRSLRHAFDLGIE